VFGAGCFWFVICALLSACTANAGIFVAARRCAHEVRRQSRPCVVERTRIAKRPQILSGLQFPFRDRAARVPAKALLLIQSTNDGNGQVPVRSHA
jgi:hypothetical protein